MKTAPVFLLWTLSLSITGSAQDQPFFNTHQTLLFTNPSFAGSNGLIRSQNFFKKNMYSNNTDTYVHSVDGYFSPLRAGLGLSYLRSDVKAGSLVTDHLAFTYAQHFNFKEKRIKIVPSIQVAYVTRTWSDYWISDPSGFRHVKNYKHRYLDINSGLLISYRNFYIGASVLHINMPYQETAWSPRLPMAYSLLASYSTAFSESAMLNISGRAYKTGANGWYQVAWNLLLFKHLLCGIGARQQSSESILFGSIGYRHNFMSACISYGQTPYKDSYGNLNQSEFMLSYNLRDKTNRKQLTSFETW